MCSSHKLIDSSDGLSNNFVLSMVLDGDGNVWVGTEQGLNRIAGRTVNVYRREQLGTVNDKILSLFYDRDNLRILIGTEQGLAVYDCTSGRFGQTLHGDRLTNYSLVDMADDHRQGVWLIFGNGRVQHLDLSTNHVTTLPVTLPGNRCAMDDGKGHLYIGHGKDGMSIIELKKTTTSPRRFQAGTDGDGGLPSNNVRRITKDSKGRIWIGTDRGLTRFELASETFIGPESQGLAKEFTNANVYDIREMADGQLWAATDIGGVMKDDGSMVETSSMNTRCILQDEYQNILIGNHSTGVEFIPWHKPLFQALNFPDSKTKRVYGITSDCQDNLWVGSEDELSVWSRSQETGVRSQEHCWKVNGMKHRVHSFARCLMTDSQGYVWMGMEDEGVIRFDTQRQTFESIDIGYGVCDIHSFMEDTDGRIWIGAEYGVCTYDKGHVSHQDAITRLAGMAPVTSFIRLSPTRLFLTTQGRGIVIIDTRTMTAHRLTMAEGLPSNNINHALADRQNGLWLASSEGLIRIPDTEDLRHFTVYDGKAGLKDRQIRAIQQDWLGRIWASTYTGIACLDTVARRFYYYGQQHGLNASGYMEGAATTLTDGSIAFGSSNGVLYFQPEETETNLETSPVRIVRCEVFSGTTNQGDRSMISPLERITRGVPLIRLNYQQNTLQIAYTVSDYAQADDVEYTYMMKGLSDKWYPGGSNDEVTFRSLQPGNYTFLLRAKLRNQDWEKAATTQLSIRILPPFWLSWWAYVLYTAIAIAAIALLIQQYKRRIALRNSLEMARRESQQKQELNEERLRFFTNITHELRTPLTLILGPLEDLVADLSLTTGSRRKVEMIYKSAGRLRDLINEILEFRKTETQNRRLTVAKGDIGHITEEIVLNYKELNRNQGVVIVQQIEKPLPAVYFDSEVITTVLNNLLSNALKYTERGSITVSVCSDGQDKVSLSVTDTGYGIARDALPHIFDRYYQAKGSHQAEGTGIGLALVKSLADLHEAGLTVESEEGKGSRFTFSLNIANTYPNALQKEDKEVFHRSDNELPLLLIVEDNADIRQYIADSFGEDFRILQAQNGQEGAELATRQIPDIIVSDIMMPKMNGIQMTRQLKDDIRTSHIPVILLTAKDSDEDKEEGYESGADSYLTKPFTAKLLASRIKNLLTSRHRLAELLSQGIGDGSLVATKESPWKTLGTLDQEFMERLNRTIEENIMQTDIDMAFLTDKMAMSHSTFYRKVKALTGLTDKEYVRMQRLHHCRRLLESGKYNVTEAAMMTGFNQMAHFREVFRKEFGVNPSEILAK